MVDRKAVVSVVKDVVGEEVVPLVRQMNNSREWSEFELAEKMGKEVNETRNLLYRLYKYNLVKFKKRKDEKKGWYVYYWSFNKERLPHIVKDANKQNLERLGERLQNEKEGNFYICKNSCVRLEFEQVVYLNFSCPECGHALHPDDNSEKIRDIEKQISKLKGLSN